MHLSTISFAVNTASFQVDSWHTPYIAATISGDGDYPVVPKSIPYVAGERFLRPALDVTTSCTRRLVSVVQSGLMTLNARIGKLFPMFPVASAEPVKSVANESLSILNDHTRLQSYSVDNKRAKKVAKVSAASASQKQVIINNSAVGIFFWQSEAEGNGTKPKRKPLKIGFLKPGEQVVWNTAAIYLAVYPVRGSEKGGWWLNAINIGRSGYQGPFIFSPKCILKNSFTLELGPGVLPIPNNSWKPYGDNSTTYSLESSPTYYSYSVSCD